MIERASIICTEDWVQPDHLGLGAAAANNAPSIGAELSLEELEKAHIAAVLASSDTLEQAARTLGIDASTLYRKRKQFHL
ncbi:Alginate biosynthesis transcriptional regulatory protein AlgB [compost metagenome]